jgi:hypothetical protein
MMRTKDVNLSPMPTTQTEHGDSSPKRFDKVNRSSQNITKVTQGNISGGNSPVHDKPISPSVNIKRLASDMNQKGLLYNQSRVSNQNSETA